MAISSETFSLRNRPSSSLWILTSATKHRKVCTSSLDPASGLLEIVLVYFADDSPCCKVSFLKCQEFCEGAALMKNPVASLHFQKRSCRLEASYIPRITSGKVEKCHKSTNPSWRQGCRFNFSSGGSNVCISLWMRRAADRPAVWQAAFSTGLPETRGPSTSQNGTGWVHTLASGVTDGIQPLPAKGCKHGQGPWQLTARAPTPTSTDICAHAAWSLGFLRAFVPSLPCEQAKGNDATT